MQHKVQKTEEPTRTPSPGSSLEFFETGLFESQ